MQLYKLAKYLCISIFATMSFGVHAAPERVVLGSYLTSLYNIDSDRGLFSADIWVWTKSDSPFNYKLKDNLEVTYLSSQFPLVYISQPSELLQKNTFYNQKKVQGTFLHDFNLAKFPFDRQKLKIYFEDSDSNIEELEFLSDKSSGFDPSISIDGWKIINIEARSDIKKYQTNFGNFSKPSDDQYSRIALEVEIKRDAPLIFLKITLGLFAAVLVAMFSTFMNAESDDLYSARLGLLGATLLAVVVNQQFADSKIGQTTTVTLIDSLHMLGFVTVFLLFIAAILSRRLQSQPVWGLSHDTFDRVSFYLALSLFSILSFILIRSAIVS
jgi:hypothetical protein